MLYWFWGGQRRGGRREENFAPIEFRGKTGNDVRRSVKGIADHRVAEGLHMDADLVGAAGFNSDLDEREDTIGRLDTFQYFDV